MDNCPDQPYWRTEHLAAGALRAAHWLEANNHPYSMFTDYDLDTVPGILDPKVFKTLIINTHSEYWSQNMYNAVVQYEAKGGNVIDISGNTVFWQVILTKTGTNVTLQKLGNWTPQQQAQLHGLGSFISSGVGDANCTPYDVLLPNHWAFQNTGGQTPIGSEGVILGTTTCLDGSHGASGWEVDRVDPSLHVFAREYSVLGESRNDYQHGNMLYMRRASAGQVFSGGSITFGQSMMVDQALGATMETVVQRFGQLSFSDFSSDGHPDVVGQRSDGTMWFYPGNGVGALGTGVQFASDWGFDRIVAPGDFDGDGKADLIARETSGNLWLFRGTGNGNVNPSGIQIGVGFNVFDTILAPGDFDGDGYPDLLARSPDGSMWLYSGTPSALSQPPTVPSILAGTFTTVLSRWGISTKTAIPMFWRASLTALCGCTAGTDMGALFREARRSMRDGMPLWRSLPQEISTETDTRTSSRASLTEHSGSIPAPETALSSKTPPPRSVLDGTRSTPLWACGEAHSQLMYPTIGKLVGKNIRGEHHEKPEGAAKIHCALVSNPMLVSQRLRAVQHGYRHRGASVQHLGLRQYGRRSQRPVPEQHGLLQHGRRREALYTNSTGAFNTANGVNALYSNTGNYNTAMGVDALDLNTSGYDNTAVGTLALYSNTTSYDNTATGAYALYSSSDLNAWGNTADGVETLYSNTTGQQNTASGITALFANTTGVGNTGRVKCLASQHHGLMEPLCGLGASAGWAVPISAMPLRWAQARWSAKVMPWCSAARWEATLRSMLELARPRPRTFSPSLEGQALQSAMAGTPTVRGASSPTFKPCTARSIKSNIFVASPTT